MGEEAVRFDKTRWPIVVVTLSGRLGDGDYDYLMAEAESLFRRSEFHVLVTDMRRLDVAASSRQRHTLQVWATKMENEYGRNNVASIKIVTSRLMRAALSAYQWLRGAPTDDRVVSTMEEALALAESACRSRGLRMERAGLEDAPKGQP